jgi:hypothetical protein
MRPNPRIYIKNRLDSGYDLLKLFTLTVLLALFLVPFANFNPEAGVSNLLSGIFLVIAYEIFFLVIFVLPPALGLMGLGYFASRNPGKRIENAAYGYIAGFLSGLVLILVITGSFVFAGQIGVALVGFTVGVALSFVSVRPLPTASKSQLAVGWISALAFFAIFFLIYPGSLLRGIGVPAEAPPRVSFEGLREQYKVGEDLAFTVRLEGFWNDCGLFPQTEVLKSRDGGNSYDSLIWLDSGTLNDYSDPNCDQNPDNISRTRQIKGNPLNPLVLSEEGLYEIKSGGDDIQGASHRFVVTISG